MTDLHPKIVEVTRRIIERSRSTREAYLEQTERMRRQGPRRSHLSCGNIAHAMAAARPSDKLLHRSKAVNIGICTAYNDMLSAHQPFATYPDVIKDEARKLGATAQVAGGVPAMCDGVTQGQPGMELSLFSRDVIAMSTAIALSHDVFDAAIMLGVCDKIVPGLVIGGLSFGHLPVVFAPAGPMPSGLPNKQKAAVRERYAQGLASREDLLDAETASYHSPGTCTFYGTANSNQMLMEIMGLQLPGTSFVQPGTPLRDALTRATAARAIDLARSGSGSLAELVDERTIVNAIVGLMATGGSTNHTIHLPAIAAAAGIVVDWDDFADISACTPLLARVYPNGSADVNQFHAAGGMAFLVRELLKSGHLHPDVTTIMGPGLSWYSSEPWLNGGELTWRPAPESSLDRTILRPSSDPFETEGGVRRLSGSLGRSIIKISSVAPERRLIDAPAVVFDSQDEFLEAFTAGRLDKDHIAVIRFQGPRVNGMPELHKLTPSLQALQNKGFRVALVTDGRMSGASGSVPAAIHLSPSAEEDSALARVEEGDRIILDADNGRLELMVDKETLSRRHRATPPADGYGWGRDLFAMFRSNAASPEAGGGVFSTLNGRRT
jgi:phosphogluconate dehydratase